MDKSLPNRRPGQVLAVALVLALAAGLWLAVADPLIVWHARRAERIEQQRIIARQMTEIAAELPELRLEAANNHAIGPPALAVFDGKTDAVAAASLQQMLQEMSQKTGAELTSVEAVVATQVGGYRQIGVRAQVHVAEWPILVRFLRLITQATPSMQIDDLQIHALAQRKAEEPLDVRFTALAFRAVALSRDEGSDKRWMNGRTRRATVGGPPEPRLCCIGAPQEPVPKPFVAFTQSPRAIHR